MMKDVLQRKAPAKRVLVVDDEIAMCNMLKKFLTKKGYEVKTVLSGEEAIKEVKEARPHIVLLDIRMSGMDGVETLIRIREIDKWIGVIMITGIKEDEIGRKCIELGAYDYIIKPLSFEYLETVVMVKLLDFGH